MPPSRRELEAQIKDLRTDHSNKEQRLNKLRDKTLDLQAKASKVELNITLNEDSRNFMRTKADIVDLGLYSATTKLLVRDRTSYSNMQADLTVYKAQSEQLAQGLVDVWARITLLQKESDATEVVIELFPKKRPGNGRKQKTNT